MDCTGFFTEDTCKVHDPSDLRCYWYGTAVPDPICIPLVYIQFNTQCGLADLLTKYLTELLGIRVRVIEIGPVPGAANLCTYILYLPTLRYPDFSSGPYGEMYRNNPTPETEIEIYKKVVEVLTSSTLPDGLELFGIVIKKGDETVFTPVVVAGIAVGGLGAAAAAAAAGIIFCRVRSRRAAAQQIKKITAGGEKVVMKGREDDVVGSSASPGEVEPGVTKPK
jgi:hypothetical protein